MIFQLFLAGICVHSLSMEIEKKTQCLQIDNVTENFIVDVTEDGKEDVTENVPKDVT